MKLLLAAATEAEITPLLQHLQKGWTASPGMVYTRGDNHIHLCITGVGMMSAAYHLIKKIDNPAPQLAIQAGVAGSYHQDIALGELVTVASEQYGDLGAEDHYHFLDVFHLGLLGKDEAPFADGRLPAPALPWQSHLPARRVSGLTVNTAGGSEFTIRSRNEKFRCDIESMEGLAFHYVCLREGIPFAQVRAISNYVTPRDRESWKMKEAIINLNNWLINFIETL